MKKNGCDIIYRIKEILDSGCFLDGINLIDPAVLKKTRNVILTGAGEELYAIEAAKPVFENKKDFKATGMFPGIEVYPMTVTDFSRYYCTYRGWHPQRKDKHLIIVADEKGRSKYSLECMERAQKYGSPSVAVTDASDNEYIRRSDYKLIIKKDIDPAVIFFEEFYAATLIGLKLSLSKGYLTQERVECAVDELRVYVDACDQARMETIKKEIEKVASKWKQKKIDMVQFVGSAQDLSVASWGAVRMIKDTGLTASVDDFEGWCHVDVFTAPNNKIGCVVVIDSKSMALSRAKEVIGVMKALGREVLVISDDGFSFDQDAEIIKLPVCSYEFGAPMLKQIPIELLIDCLGQDE